jgi:hypothetical protein
MKTPFVVIASKAALLGRCFAAVFSLVALGAFAHAQTFSGGVAGTGSGASNLYGVLARSPSEELYGFWKLQASASGVHYIIKWNGTSWTQLASFTAQQMLAGSQGTQDDVALAVDGEGGLHVASRLYGPGADPAAATRVVVYGYSADGTNWAFTEIYSSPVGVSNHNTREPSIAVDANNRPHIIFRADTPGYYALRYHSFDGTAWSGSELYSTPSKSYEINGLSFGLDSAGHAHIAFVTEVSSGTAGSPYYMTNASGEWSTPAKLADGNSSTSSPKIAVAVDGSDHVHVVYNNGDANRGLYYYSNVSGSFTGGQINGNLTGGITRHSLAINASGHLFLSYNAGSSSSGIAGYAYRLNGQSTWTTGTAYSNVSDVANTATSALPVNLSDGHVATMLVNTLTGPRYLRWAQATIASSNTAPAFVGSTLSLSVNQNAGATDIKGLLHASDSDSGQTLTWSVTGAPSHGTLSSFAGATASSGGADLSPGGTLTYTPAAGYAGADSFTIRVSDGSASASRTIAVAVNDNVAPTVVSVIRLTPSAQDISTGPVMFRVTYSEAVTNVAAANFAIEAINGGSVIGTVTEVSGTGATREVTVAITEGSGEFRLNVINQVSAP